MGDTGLHVQREFSCEHGDEIQVTKEKEKAPNLD